MSGKAEVKTPEDIRREWEEIRFCASLIREGRARIVSVTRKDGKTFRYTELKQQGGN